MSMGRSAMTRQSALDVPDAARMSGPGLTITARGFVNFIAIAAWPGKSDQVAKSMKSAKIELPTDLGSVIRSNGNVAMASAPGRWFVELADEGIPDIAGEDGAVTDICHARCSFLLDGPDAVQVAQKLAPVDFGLPEYGPDRMLQSGSGHTIAFTLWRQSTDRFVLYVERSFGRDFWHNLQAESAEFGCFGENDDT